jgi:hypothetical protein
VVHVQALAGGDGDRGRTGVGLQAAGVAEPGAVIANLAQHPGAGEWADAGETGQDLRVWMLGERCGGGLGQVVGGAASLHDLYQVDQSGISPRYLPEELMFLE